MDMNARHSLLREKLDKLGFTQPLPIASIALVSSLLDDLLLANNKLAETQKCAAKLEKEKSAWELGVEPYKCDNSKLLAEVNSLHTDIIRQRDTYQHKIYELNKRARLLEQENRQLSERCAHLKNQIDELESQFEDPKQRKFRNDLLNEKRKPFISTVRSGESFSTLKSIENMETANASGKSKCFCQNSEKNDIFKRLYAEQEVNRVKSHLELIDLYKAQLDSRNREISRLNQLLVGGRPIDALEKDCCYRGIRTLADDVEQLQKDKSKIQAEYEEAIQNHHAAIDTIAVLKQQNQKIANELNAFKEIALSVESEANVSLETLHKRNAALKAKLNEFKTRIHELEMQLRGDGSRLDARAAQIELQFLHEKLERGTERETELKSEVDRLTKRNAKLKGKLSADACKCNLSQSVSTRDVGTMTSINQAFGCADHPLDVNRLKIDRDFYKQEYLKLLDKPISDCEIGRLRQQLVAKEMELVTLRKQIEKMKRDSDTAMPCRSVEAVIHRLERERNVLQDTVDRLTIERNDLRDNLHLQTSTQREHIIRDECEIERLKHRIREIENDNLNLHTVQGPAKTTINLLKDELNQLRKQMTDLMDENSKLRASNNQMRLLQEQTENALTKHQSRLTNSERQLNEAESKLNVVDSSRADVCREIGELRAEVNRLRNLYAASEEEKDNFIVDLDTKTEKIYQLEAQVDSLKTRLIEMEAEVATTHRQLDNAESHKKQSKNSLHQITTEMDELRKQNHQLKTTNENMHFENRRLTNELADAECTSGVIKAKLSESEKEVDRLKRQLQQYVQEVQRAEELLLRKEEERSEMLEQYRNLTHDAVVLEGTNHSLELEAAESKRTANELEGKLAELQAEISEREHDLNISNGKVCELTKQVNQLELDLEKCKHQRNSARKELDAVKELCNKLDIETDKLNAEVHEYSEIRRELERDNEKLRSEVAMFRAGDEAANDSLKQLLASTRKELDDERLSSNRHKIEIDKLKSRIDELQNKLSEEHSNAVRQGTLAKEYNIQIQELRNQLTDTRFDRVCSRLEQSNERFSSN